MNKEDFQIRYKLLKLDGPTIDRIRQMAEGEDRDARYGLGRYLYVVRPEEDWVDRAFEYLQSDAVAATQKDVSQNTRLEWRKSIFLPLMLMTRMWILMKMTIRTTTVVLMPMRNFIDGSMNIFRKIKLSARYAKAVYLVSAAYSFTAAGLCVFDPTLTPTFVLLKLLFIPVIWYLFKSFQRGQTIYFYLNLGISRTEYYSIPFVVDFVVFVALLTFSICVGNVIR